jgi:hypothetical protein
MGADPRTREVLLWSLPAILLGVVLRGLLTYSMPYGYVQYDTADFLVTTQRFAANWDLVIHNKKTFLTPILFTLAYINKVVPALIFVPLLQHLFGLVMTLFVGGIVRLWFRHWKWFIIPATVLTTANPAILWYEHALMAEAHYVFCVVLLVLVATAFALFRTRGLFISLLLTLVFTAGSRPEGKLYFSVAILLVALTYWGNWKAWLRHMAILLVVTMGTFAITKTKQAGTLLYATVLPLAPDTPKSVPDFGPRINPLRDKFRAEDVTVRRELTSAEKDISEIVQKYLNEKGIKGDVTAAFCQKLAAEACLNQPRYLPSIALNKFLMSMRNPSSAGFTEYWIYTKQLYAFTRKPWLYDLTPGLTGQKLLTKEQVDAWLHAHASVPLWFAKLQGMWDTLTIHYALPAHRYLMTGEKVVASAPNTQPKQQVAPKAKSKSKADTDSSEEEPDADQSAAGNAKASYYEITGLPWFFVLALAGMAGAILWPGPLRIFHLSWILSLGAIWFLVMLTGVVNARYRFIFEPFCALYALLFFDLLGRAIQALLPKQHKGAAEQPKPSPALTTT